MTTFIYVLCEPSGEPRYVGKANDPARRLTDHFTDKGHNRKARWLRKLAMSCLRPRLIVLDEVDRLDWQATERQWIAWFKAQGCDLCNLTPGGDGVTEWAEESLERLREASRLRYTDPTFRVAALAVLREPARCAKISAALTGKPKSKEHVAKLPQNQPGRKLNAEHANKVRAVLRQHSWRWPKGVMPEVARVKAVSALRGNKHTLGRVMPEHEKRQRSLANKGRPKSQEWREKARVAALRRWRVGDRSKLSIAERSRIAKAMQAGLPWRDLIEVTA